MNVEVAKEDRDVLRFLWVGHVNSCTIIPMIDAIELYSKSKKVLLNEGFRLRKWVSNSAKVREMIAREEGESVIKFVK